MARQTKSLTLNPANHAGRWMRFRIEGSSQSVTPKPDAQESRWAGGMRARGKVGQPRKPPKG
jgi:hypothetical protein